MNTALGSHLGRRGLKSRQVPEDEVRLVVRNGRWEAKGDCVIHDDDHIELFPFLQGG